MTSRRRLVVGLSLGVVLVLAATAAIVWAALRTRGGPVEAVRDYVELIAAGDAVGASQLVDPAQYTGYDGESTPAPPPTVSAGAEVTASDDLVLDRDMMAVVAGQASQRIEVADVALDYGDSPDVPVGETVDVGVTYLLRGVSTTAVLRAERMDDTWFGFTQWRVVDPLLVPLVVQSNTPELGPAEIRDDEDRHDRGASSDAGSAHPAVRVPAEIDLSGPDAEGASQRATLLYPGVYRIGGTTSTYLTAAPKTVVLAGAATTSTTSEAFGDVVSTSLWFEPTQALSDRISEEATEFVAACFAAMPSPPADCPGELRARSGFATDVVLNDAPVLDDITSYQTEHVDGVATEPAVRATFTTGRFDFTSDDGGRDDAIFFLYAWVHPEGDDVTIEFRPSL
ncbi:hypothetical protein GCM10010988_16870 [Cnuibacter physcomitrellae]|uniref:hypothetical protein n=1 Tax=Cnuibacter physcomitrellae TaxID=1619308 RepID=UPI0012F4CAFA|nr:hypothetical protein [Cnuibacter physcomitrellae]GGI38016.1 hypothetical protein GCM10010988_16870 [Cnuibacter physcomitrellae]